MERADSVRRVHYGVYRRSTVRHPVIRMRGRHLEKWGFRPGDRIRVTMERDRITITRE